MLEHDLTALTDDEIPDWYYIAQIEHLTHLGAHKYRCQRHAPKWLSTEPDKARSCSRNKGHSGPHVSGVHTREKTIIWY